MKKKSDKVLILFVIILAFAILSWFIPQGTFSYGVYTAVESPIRAGIFDIFVDLFLAIYYNYTDILYILVVGGCYGVLSKTKSYRKLVDKTANLIKGKEMIAMGVTTLIVSLITSFTDQLLLMFVAVPFISTVFMRNGYDRLTALFASFGGIFVGFIGQTFGYFGIDYLKQVTALTPSYLIGWKFGIYVIALVLFNVFAMLHMKKHSNVDETEYDLFSTEELQEKVTKGKKATKIWPIVTVFVITLIILVMGHISWTESFNVTAFTNGYSKFTESFKVADVPVFSTLLGSQMQAFGKWENLIVASFVTMCATIIISLIDKMKFGDFVLRFEVGIKKVLRLAIVFGLVQTVYVMSRNFQWVDTIINKLLGSGSFNILTLMIISFVATLFTVQPGYGNYIYGAYLANAFTDKLAISALVWHVGQGFALLLAPTSLILFMALSYYDITYKKYLSGIWKFALCLFGATLFVFIVQVL